MSVLGDRLKLSREGCGLTQKEAAFELDVAQNTLSRYETGERNPDPATLQRLADLYKVSLDYLMGRVGAIVTSDGNNGNGSINSWGGDARLLVSQGSDPIEKKGRDILAMLNGDKELYEFWQEMLSRDDLQLLFKQTKPLSPESVKRVIRYIKMVEDEESDE